MSRPGPAHELSLYSEILKVPLVQIFDLSELTELSKKVSPKTQILIDWRGVSPYAVESWKALEDVSGLHPHFQVILTASLVSDLRIWEPFREHLSALPMAGVALTQADLEHRLGKAWEAARRTNLPIALFSAGKNVPGDFFEGRGFPFAQLFFHGYAMKAKERVEI
jgi:flagellar biosynthesis GTPase FlhF